MVSSLNRRLTTMSHFREVHKSLTQTNLDIPKRPALPREVMIPTDPLKCKAMVYRTLVATLHEPHPDHPKHKNPLPRQQPLLLDPPSTPRSIKTARRSLKVKTRLIRGYKGNGRNRPRTEAYKILEKFLRNSQIYDIGSWMSN